MTTLLFFMIVILSFAVIKLYILISNSFNLLFNKLDIDSDIWGDDENV